MKCFFDARQLDHAPQRELHNGDWTDHVEIPARASDIAALFDPQAPVDFGRAPIAAVHDAGYLDFLESAWADWRASGRPGDAIPYTFPVAARRDLALDRIDARLGRYSFDAATPVTQHCWTAAYWAVQCVLAATDHVLESEAANGANGDPARAFALCRPPGHHAGADYLGGYSYLNNAAIAAREAVRRGAGPVAVLDVDYHHGNGTQDIFWQDGAVFYASIHADPKTDYPFYWGHADERGEGNGAGANLNLPLPRGTGWQRYQAALATALDAIAKFGARTLFVSFGADTFAGDPISQFALETRHYRPMGAAIHALGLPTVVVMEGGYAVTALAENVRAFLSGFAA